MKIISYAPFSGNKGMNVLSQNVLTELNKLVSLNIQDCNQPNFKFIPSSSSPTKVNLILAENTSPLWNFHYSGYKIAYAINESTLFPNKLFDNLLNNFDETWVPSKWQKDNFIKQGFPKEKLHIIPGGVNTNLFYPSNTPTLNKFRFIIIGKLEYRKSIIEIVSCFLHVFKNNKDVELLLLVDNVYIPSLKVEEELKKYNLIDPKIKIIRRTNLKDYIQLIKSSNVFLSCSKGEGWNLPLIEALSCGIPSIYSKGSAQMEYTEGKGLGIEIKRKIPIPSSYKEFQDGEFDEPDFHHFMYALEEVYNNWDFWKEWHLKRSKYITNNFSTKVIAQKSYNRLKQIQKLL